MNHIFVSLYGAYADLDGVLESIEQVKYDTGADVEMDRTPSDIDVSS